jgi:Helix-turn-helix domain
MTPSKLESVSSSARRLGISPGRFYDLVRNGIFPPGVVVRLGRHIHINPGRLDQFIESGGKALPGGWRKEVP